MKHILLIIYLILFSILSCNLYAEGFDYYAHIKKYVKCEAVQNVAANISSESEEEFYQHELHFASLDSRQIALEFARAGNYSPQEVEELYVTYLDEYRAILSESEDVDKFLKSLSPQVTKCRKLNDMQKDLLQRNKSTQIEF